MTHLRIFGLFSVLLSTASLHAQFTPGPNPVTGTVGAQTLSGGTGTVSTGGTISVASGIAVNVTGTSTLFNNGTIQSGGGSRAVQTSSGIILTLTNTGLISSVNEDAIRPGNGGVINNSGTIIANTTNVASPAGSDGIDLRTQQNVTVTNTGSISGRHGIATDGANVGPSSLTVNNNAGTISAFNGSGLNVDGVNVTVTANVTNAFGATIRGGLMSASTNGDGDGIDIDGVLTLDNSGDILGYGAKGIGGDGGQNNPEALAIGGGTIINRASGRIIGSSLAADAPNGTTTRDGRGITVDDSSVGNAIAATTITNSGLIQGKTGYGIKIVGTFADTITNDAGGTIRGANNTETAPVIRSGDGNDTVNNAGTITHDSGASQIAISTEGGNDLVRVTGNVASITGGINGGTGTDTVEFDLGSATNSFSYSGSLSEVESVRALSGRTFLSGTSTYTGTTGVGTGTSAARLENNGLLTTGGTVTVKSNATLAGSGSLSLDGSTLTVENGGNLASGSEASRGRFTLVLGSADIEGTLRFQLDGLVAGVAGGYDQFRLGAANTGIFNLDSTSQLSITLGFLPVEGTTFTIIDIANSATTLTGQFTGLAEGSTFTADGTEFRISYAGGTGNDVTLTAIPEPSTWALTAVCLLGFLAMRRLRQSKNHA